MEHFLHMKWVETADGGWVEAVLASPRIPNYRQTYKGESYAEVLQQVLNEWASNLTRHDDRLIIDFKVV